MNICTATSHDNFNNFDSFWQSRDLYKKDDFQGERVKQLSSNLIHCVAFSICPGRATRGLYVKLNVTVLYFSGGYWSSSSQTNLL